MTNSKSGWVHLHWSALSTELGALRENVDALGADYIGKYGSGAEVAQRAEALSAAIQRLEWAISRQQLQRMSAGAG